MQSLNFECIRLKSSEPKPDLPNSTVGQIISQSHQLRKESNQTKWLTTTYNSQDHDLPRSRHGEGNGRIKITTIGHSYIPDGLPTPTPKI